MKTIQSGEIEAEKIDGYWYGSGSIRAERGQGDSYVTLTLPKGPKTKKTVTMRVSDAELSRLAAWMKGEVR